MTNAISPATSPVKNQQQTQRNAKLVLPDSFEAENHFYPRVLNASLHPMVASFLSLGNVRITKRYCHLHPGTDSHKLEEVLNYLPQYFHWAGADLFNVTNERAQRQMIVIETNSCPSGQKSMPSWDDSGDSFETSYHRLLNSTFRQLINMKQKLPEGELAVVYDKNVMEASGYAAVLSEMTNEAVHLVEFYEHDKDPPAKWIDGVLYIRKTDQQWVSIRACFRYVTQKPWNRFPVNSKTLVLNTILACLSGGRNKLVAAKAYDFFNAELSGSGLKIRTPDTVPDVNLVEIPLYVKAMGWNAVVKIPYSNAGQGVFTITSEKELDIFMAMEHHYDKFIVQALVGNSKWSSQTKDGTYYHVGTIPNRKNHTFVADVRMMISSSEQGFKPLVVYGRRARVPLAEELSSIESSWDMLGTNLSVKEGNSWTTETNRLILMDRKDFNKLGISIDDLIDGYVQTVLSAIAIDKMCKKLVTNGQFNIELFSSINQDEQLINELMVGGSTTTIS